MKRWIVFFLLMLTSSALAVHWLPMYDDFNYNNVGTVPDTIKVTLKYNGQTVLNDSSITPAIKWRFVRGVDSAGVYDAVIHYAYNAGGINKNVTKMFFTSTVGDSEIVYRQMARVSITADIDWVYMDTMMQRILAATSITTEIDWATLKDSMMYWIWAYDGAGDYVPEANRTIGNPGGSTSRSYDVAILLRDSTNAYAGAPYVPVEVQSDAGTVLISDRASDVNGYVYTSLDTGYYYVYPRTTAYIFPASNYAIHVTAAGTHNINCASRTWIASTTASMCSFQMYLDTIGGFGNAQVWFSLMPKSEGDVFIDSSSSKMMVPEIYTSATSAGFIQQELNKNKNIRYLRSGEYGKTYWLVRIAKRGGDLNSPDLKFIINTSDSTYYRVQ